MDLAKLSLNYYNTAGISETFNQISWTNSTINQFEIAVRNSKNYQICLGYNISVSNDYKNNDVIGTLLSHTGLSNFMISFISLEYICLFRVSS